MQKTRDFPPPSPGAVLRQRVLANMDINQDLLAKALGVSRFTVNQVLNGRRAVTPEMALRLGHVLGTSPELWLKLQAQLDLYRAKCDIGDELAKLPRLRETDETPTTATAE